MADTKPLIVVESPAKARTIAKFLGPDYVVESSIGHIRDLPPSAAEIPKQHKGKPWARLGIDVENGFAPLYVVPQGKKKQVATLKKRLASASELYLATDEDREGEAIAWHIANEIRGSGTRKAQREKPIKRVLITEITKRGVAEAFSKTRDLDAGRYNSQQARRILDRLVGYQVSPLLWD